MALGHWVMNGSTLATNMSAFRNHFAFILMIMILLVNPLDAEIEDNDVWQVDGGYSVLMEQYTATWCEICASVDSWMPDYTSANGDRVIRIAIHDTLDDPLGTPITDYRLQRYNDSRVFPTFWFDGNILAGGAPDTTTLHRSLLSSETQRSGDTDINLEITFISGELLISSILSNWENELDTKVTIMVLDYDITIPQNIAINGIETHHDVLFAYNEINLNNSQIWSYPDESWSNTSAINDTIKSKYYIPLNKSLEDLKIVVIHEYVDSNIMESNTLGATSIYLGSNSQISKLDLTLPIILILLISIIPISVRSRK